MRMKYDDSGHCGLALVHHFVSIVDNGGQVGIYCTHCEYILFEHVSDTSVTPSGKLIAANSPSAIRTLSLYIPKTSAPTPRLLQTKNMVARFWKKIAF